MICSHWLAMLANLPRTRYLDLPGAQGVKTREVAVSW